MKYHHTREEVIAFAKSLQDDVRCHIQANASRALAEIIAMLESGEDKTRDQHFQREVEHAA